MPPHPGRAVRPRGRVGLRPTGPTAVGPAHHRVDLSALPRGVAANGGGLRSPSHARRASVRREQCQRGEAAMTFVVVATLVLVGLGYSPARLLTGTQVAACLVSPLVSGLVVTALGMGCVLLRLP